jgi:hypothetical protein
MSEGPILDALLLGHAGDFHPLLFARFYRRFCPYPFCPPMRDLCGGGGATVNGVYAAPKPMPAKK